MALAVAEILKEEGYVEDVSTLEKEITIRLKYVAKKSAIRHLEKFSRPGMRIYKNYLEIPRVLNGLGISIFSTSKGVMTGKKAKLEKIGGEYICNIW
jgi:small subunit ribosomal protein S8